MIPLVAVASNSRTRVLFAAVALDERGDRVTPRDIERVTGISDSAVRVHLRCLEARQLLDWDRETGLIVPLVHRVEKRRAA